MSEDLDFKVFGRSLKTQEITKKLLKAHRSQLLSSKEEPHTLRSQRTE